MAERAAIYVRVSVSKNGEAESDSIENQFRDLTRLAKAKKLEIVATFKDDGISGYKGKRRDGFDGLIRGMSRREFDLILVRHHDRFERNEGDFDTLRFAAIRNGIKWMDAGGSVTDPSTSSGGLTASMMSSIARYESQVKSERLRNYFEGSALKGELQASPRTFGYDDNDRSKVVPWEADLIRQAYLDVAAGRTVGSIVRSWNEQGVKQRKGSTRWSYAHLNAILRRPRNAGLLSYRGELLDVLDDDGQPVRGQWETVIDVDTWHTVQAILSDPGRRTSPGFLPRHLSSGSALCGVCGAVMRSNTATDNRRGTRYSILRCTAQKNGERHASARLDDLERLVRQAIFDAFVHGPEAILPAEATVDHSMVQKRLTALQEARQDILDLIRDRLATKAQAMPQLASLNEEEREIRNSIAEARSASAGAHMVLDLRRDLWSTLHKDWAKGFDQAVELRRELEQRFDALPIEDRRGLVATLLDIRVHPGRGVGKYEIAHRLVTTLNEQQVDVWPESATVAG